MGYQREYDADKDLYRCTGCGEWKPRDGFYRHPTARWGLQSRCKVCQGEEHKVHYQRRAAKAREALAMELYQAELEDKYGSPPNELFEEPTDEDIAALNADPVD